MGVEWIEEAVKERVVEVTRECDESSTRQHDILVGIINRLRKVLPKSEMKTLLTLEDLYIQHQATCINFGYRRGLNDGLQIHKLCNDDKEMKSPF